MPAYQFGCQEDAQEFLLGFLDHLIKSCFKHPNPIQRFVLKNQQVTPIFQIFGFKSRSQVLCENCGYQSNTYNDQCNLTLQIPNSSASLSLEDCLRQYVQADRLCGENKYSCDGCKRKVNALKTCSIETLPNILIVDFVRYNLGRKNSEIIEYPLELSLNRYLSSSIDEHNAKRVKSNKNSKQTSSLSFKNTVYDLYGIIVHQGSSRQFGHYYSYCRGFESDSTWYKCNDETISRMKGPEAILEKQAYILFYQARNTVDKADRIKEPLKKQVVDCQGPPERRDDSDSPVNSTASQTPPPIIKETKSQKSDAEMEQLREENMKQIAEFKTSFLAPKQGASEPKPQEVEEVRPKLTIKLPSMRIKKMRAIEEQK